MDAVAVFPPAGAVLSGGADLHDGLLVTAPASPSRICPPERRDIVDVVLAPSRPPLRGSLRSALTG